MERRCLTCGTVQGPFEKNHLGTRALWPEIWFWFCVPCHRTFTAWQMALGIIRAGPKGGTFVPERGEVGRSWALMQGAVIASLVAIARCQACQETVAARFVRMGQTSGIVSEMLARVIGEAPILTDPVGADGRSRPDPGAGPHERGLLEMLSVVGAALIPEAASFYRRAGGSGVDVFLGEGAAWMEQLAPAMARVLDGLERADTIDDAWDALVAERDAFGNISARIGAALPGD